MNSLLRGLGWSAAAACVALSFATASLGAPEKPKAAETPKVQPVGPEELKKALAEQKGKVVVLNLWATWCPPCVAEFPDLVKLHNTYEKEGLTVVTLSLDEPGDREDVAKFLEQQKATFPALHVKGGDVQKLVGTIDKGWPGAIPVTYIFDRTGKQVGERMVGKHDYEQFVSRVRPLLAKNTASAPASPAAKAAPALSFQMKGIDGAPVDLRRFQGQVLLVTNVASRCGNTKQYASLQKLYDTYKDSGFAVLCFPANEFGGQEPGTDAEIKTFCTSNYGVTFPMFSKVVVKGEGQAPFYKFLTDKATNPRFGGDIEWNFAKFLINRKGEVIARFKAGTDPMTPEVVAAVEKALSEAP